MNKIISANNLNPASGMVSIEIEFPRKCPICSVAYSNEPINSYCIESSRYGGNVSTLYSVYFCPHCDECFLVQYRVYDHSYKLNKASSMTNVYPTPNLVQKFSKEIEELSPSFVKIYHQSEKAEASGLDEICGMGFRKSLEFLVKDFAIFLNPAEESAIGSAFLASCIDHYVDSKKIKALAKASAWLGNDETHYLRKHENYNVQHLKLFITAVVTFIESELAYEKSMELLSSPK